MPRKKLTEKEKQEREQLKREREQLKRQDKLVEEMDELGFWDKDSPPYAVNKITRKRLAENWESLKNGEVAKN